MTQIIFVNVMVLVSKICTCEPMHPSTVCDYISSSNPEKKYVTLLQDNRNGTYTPANGYVKLTCDEENKSAR